MPVLPCCVFLIWPIEYVPAKQKPRGRICQGGGIGSGGNCARVLGISLGLQGVVDYANRRVSIGFWRARGFVHVYRGALHLHAFLIGHGY